MKQEGVITIEKLYGGWAKDLSTSQNKTVEGNQNQYGQAISTMVNRPGYEGHISPGLILNTMTDASSVVNALPVDGVVTSTGSAFCVLANARVINFMVNGTSIPNDAHDVTAQGIHSGHTTFSGADSAMVTYVSVTGTSPSYVSDEYVFYSWEDNTDGDVAQFKKSTGVYKFNYLSALGTQNNGTALQRSTVSSQYIPHPLLVGQDNNLYIGNGRFLASHDPTTTSVSYQALDLKPGWVIVGLEKYQNYIAIVAFKQNVAFFSNIGSTKSECKMFLWDGFSTSWNFEYDLKDNYVSNILRDGLTDIYVITYGRNSTVKLKKFDGYGFNILFETALAGLTPGGVLSNSPCIGAIDLWLNHIVWTNYYNGEINEYGSPDGIVSDKYESGFHQLGLVNQQNGMCKNLIQNILFIGNYTGSTYKILYSDLSKYDTLQMQMNSILYPLPTNSTLEWVKVYPSLLGETYDFSVSVVKDYNSIAFGGTNDVLRWNPTATTTGTSLYYLEQHQWKGDTKNTNACYVGIKSNAVNTTTGGFSIRKVEVGYTYDDENV